VPLHSPHSPRADPPPTTTPPLSLHAALPIYPGASPCPGADSSAVGGEGADAGLLVDGHQVGEGEGPAEGLVVGLQLAGVFDQRDGAGDALVAAAGIDDNRKLAAVHAGVGACGRPCFGAGGDVISAGAQENGADVGAVVAPQPFLRDGGVVADLPVQNAGNVRNVYGGDEVPDVFHVEESAVRATVILAVGDVSVRRFSGRLIQDVSVLFNQDD